MGDPDLYRGEQVLLRTPGVYVKSIPFEGILTNMRIMLVDRAKNILPTKEVAYDMIMEAEIGANAIGDPILTLTVQTQTGENRQMILTFAQREGGNRENERDEWVRIIQQGVSAARGAAVRQAPAAPPQRVQVKQTAEPGSYNRPVQAPEEPVGSSVPETVFCTKCGNQVLAGSAFCNKCGSPIVAPVRSSRQAPPVQAPVYEPPAPKVSPESFRTTQPQSPRPAVPLQQKPAKKGFLAGLFGGGKKKQAPLAPRPAAPPQRIRPNRNPLPVKKIIVAGVIIVVLIAVLAIGALVVYPMISSGSEASSGDSPGGESSGPSGTTTPSAVTTGPLSNTGVASITVKETTAPTVPVTGVWIMIDYIGGYKGTYGSSSDLQKIENSGARIFEVVDPSGTIQANFEKKDSSTKHEMFVSIYKDGKLLKSGSTKDSYGKVSISADSGITAVSTTATTTKVTTATTTKKA